MNIKVKETMQNYSFVLPALIMFCLFSVYPYLKVIQLSLFEWDGISSQMFFVGLRNFKDVLFDDPLWWRSVSQAGYITFLALTVQNILALLLALVVAREIRGGNVYRVIFYLPPVLSGIVVGLIWNWIYDGDYGLFNHFFNWIGLAKFQRAWLGDPKTALTCIAIIHMWKGFGWGFIILLAGLQTIPEELYEAAHVDGAGTWHRFKYITVPLMMPVFFLVSILTILGTMQIFDIIISTTRGAYYTDVPILRIYFSMLREGRFGYACAQGLIFGLILLTISMIQLKLGTKVRTVNIAS